MAARGFRNFAGRVADRVGRRLDGTRSESARSRPAGYGEDVALYPGVRIINPRQVSIRSHTHVGENCYLQGGGRLLIGAWCEFANNSVVLTGGHLVDGARYYGRNALRVVRIGENVWIGAGSRILPGVTIGSNSILGAGAVVTRNVPDDTIVAGVPARKIGGVPRCK